MPDKTIQQVIAGAIDAEAGGVPVDWKAMCLQTYEVSMAEIKRLNEELYMLGEDKESTTEPGHAENPNE